MKRKVTIIYRVAKEIEISTSPKNILDWRYTDTKEVCKKAGVYENNLIAILDENNKPIIQKN